MSVERYLAATMPVPIKRGVVIRRAAPLALILLVSSVLS